MHASTLRWLTAGTLILFAACSPSGPRRASVSGNVRVDGQPVARGAINFIPVEGTHGPTAGAPIENGRYAIGRVKGVTVGRNRVTVSCPQKTGRKIPGRLGDDAVDEWAESLPAHYNTHSTLVREISPGSNELDFDLTGKKPPAR